MTIEKLLKYYELVKELQGTNHVYKDVTVEIPDETVIKETWHNGNMDKFHSVEFQAKDLDDIKKRIYDKTRYIKQKNAETY